MDVRMRLPHMCCKEFEIMTREESIKRKLTSVYVLLTIIMAQNITEDCVCVRCPFVDPLELYISRRVIYITLSYIRTPSFHLLNNN